MTLANLVPVDLSVPVAPEYPVWPGNSAMTVEGLPSSQLGPHSTRALTALTPAHWLTRVQSGRKCLPCHSTRVTAERALAREPSGE